jgi:hypothetical protein
MATKPSQEELEDRPHTGDRGWRGLVAEAGERETFIGIVALLALVVVTTLIWGLPGFFIPFVALTLAIMVVLVIISVGS